MKYANFVVFRSNAILNIDSVDILCQSSEKIGLCWMKSFSETLQTLLYFVCVKKHIVYFLFMLKKVKLHEMKNEKTRLM